MCRLLLIATSARGPRGAESVTSTAIARTTAVFGASSTASVTASRSG